MPGNPGESWESGGVFPALPWQDARMTAWVVEIGVRSAYPDPQARLCRGICEDLGFSLEGPVLAIRGFLLPGELEEAEVRRAARELFADPISERFRIARTGAGGSPEKGLWEEFEGHARLLVQRKPGVMDPVARSARAALGDLGIEVEETGTYRAWLLPLAEGKRAEALPRIARRLSNDVIEEVLFDRLPAGLPHPGGETSELRVEVPIREADDEELMRLSSEGCLSLDLGEMRTIQGHFRELGREPSSTELETLAQTWSEHCKHKTLAGRIEMEGGKTYENFLKETVFGVTKRLDPDWCVSVFSDNAGIVEFDGEDCLCIKVETHNHPSAIEPFGGAGTGVGGVIRDILGTGLGAKPLCNLDVFCVAPPDMAPEELPAGTLHPARILDQITAGVRDYGNPIGIPTVTGAVHTDPAFVGNPLVYVGTVGILPKRMAHKKVSPGDLVVVAGGRTGRDGIHGATFSSVELHEESETVSSGAVQIGDPITEKKLLDALLEARDLGLYSAITDCGAGGLSSAVGEMGEDCGARVELETVPLKYEGLTPTEIWISEAQERMVFAVPPEKWEAFSKVFEHHEVEYALLGTFTDTGRLEISYKGTPLCDLSMAFLHDGVPKRVRRARYQAPEPKEETPPAELQAGDLGQDLKAILADFNVCSREWIIRQYDHEVQAHSGAKPFSGPRQKGPGDAAVLAVKPDKNLGFALGTGLNPRYSWIDPASMAEAALDEAVRNVVVRGGNPTRCAVLDNYCWGNTEKPEQLGALVRATEALCEAALHYRTPFVSGKDSLNNEFRVGDRTISIPGCLLVTAMAPVPALDKVPGGALERPGSPVYLLGTTYAELGGSAYYKQKGLLGSNPPRLRDPGLLQAQYAAFFELTQIHEERVWTAAHDLSEGGLAVAAAELCFGSPYGLLLDLGSIPGAENCADDFEALFSESLGRILVEVHPELEEAALKWMEGLDLPFQKVGEVLDEPRLQIDGIQGDLLLDIPISELREAWQAPLARGPLACVPGSAPPPTSEPTSDQGGNRR
ncbi:MAG TPA: phosphoribosylformylglycinamidine synthase subunit PurL [Planctomycetes bacterium]|nr:phosphoribosylformylglycinamidine synthase subunit PurL [Planctomycetota bacterium]